MLPYEEEVSLVEKKQVGWRDQPPIVLKSVEQSLTVGVTVEQRYLYMLRCCDIYRWCKACLLRREAFPRPWPNPVDEKVEGRGTHGCMLVAGLSNPGGSGSASQSSEGKAGL